ncbi:MAG: hypothetical protein ABJB74_13040 [Gemmatimonas sp.]
MARVKSAACRAVATVVVSGICALTTALAQTPAASTIPVRKLTNIVSSDTTVLMGLSGMRYLPNGSVLVNDPNKRQLVLFDSTLKKYTIIADTSTNSPNSYGLRPSTGGLIAYIADSSLYVDSESGAFLVIDPSGAFTRVMAPTRPSDLRIIVSAPFGTAGFDAKGRLIYKSSRPAAGNNGFAIPTDGKPLVLPQSDSSPIMRMDLDNRTVDTIAMMKNAVVKQMIIGNQNSIRIAAVINPLPAADEWTLTPDGTIAIVRTQDYHIDWLGADGKLVSTPKMPFEWKRITLEEKQQMLDSVKKADADRLAKLPPQPPPPPGISLPPIMPIMTVEPSEIPDFYPPVRAGQVRSDYEGRVWILPSTSIAGAAGGLAYDVVNREGEIVERVQLPKDRTLVGFGPRGSNIIFMHNVKSLRVAAIERAEVVR